MLTTILLIFLLQQVNYNYLSCLVLSYALAQSFNYDMKLAYFDSLVNFNYFITDSISNSAAIVLLLLMFWLIISMSSFNPAFFFFNNSSNNIKVNTPSSLSSNLTSLNLIKEAQDGNKLNKQKNDAKSKTHPSISLLILAVIAIISLAGSGNLISTIVCIEIQSLVMYIVLAFNYSFNNDLLIETNTNASQFGMSYLINAAVATAFLLMGLSYNQPIIVAIGLLWKLGAWPMQAWLITLSDAVPKQLSAFLLTLSKLGLALSLATISSGITSFLLIISNLNLIIGSVLALYEIRYKRLFAWLSLTQLGYFLIAISFLQTTNAIAYFEHYFIYTMLLLLLFNFSNTDLANLIKSWDNSLVFVFILSLFAIAGLPTASLFWLKLDFIVQLSNQAVIIALLATLISSLIYVRLIRLFYFYSYNLI